MYSSCRRQITVCRIAKHKEQNKTTATTKTEKDVRMKEIENMTNAKQKMKMYEAFYCAIIYSVA